MKECRLILGDQLNENHSWFHTVSPNTFYLFVEADSEVRYVRHHIQKVKAIFMGMKAFAKSLVEKGHIVEYIELNQKDNQKSISANVIQFCQKRKIDKFSYQLPDEYRLDLELQNLCKILNEKGVQTEAYDTEHFLSPRDSFKTIFPKKSYRMENFYRYMRKQYNFMLDSSGEPWGGQWNFDAMNRKKYDGKIKIPSRKWKPSYSDEVLQRIPRKWTMGEMPTEGIIWPITRKEALNRLDEFLEIFLDGFGDYQDAMLEESPYLFHSCLSFALNVKLISPKEVIERAIRTYEKKRNQISLSNLEGFVRQILGWREFTRGLYWAEMPSYQTLNHLEHQRELPSWYWTGETKMNCMSYSIRQSLHLAYAHHIQRLMVIGNFSLLYGVNPDELDKWYLGIYIDAFEWVEITNTRGMSQFADGGKIASKPYVSSANYIDKMSNYCKNCAYDKKTKSEVNSCPYNSLYWHFFDRHKKILEKNPRIGMVYHTWGKMNSAEKKRILARANWILENGESL
ncbi:cryptochrome/photolyase family protein [Leptospira ryugenii]|nr:cryptochrome/photolyase family protein [Leptospira ryugenii]